MKTKLLTAFIFVFICTYAIAQNNESKPLSLLNKETIVGMWELKTIQATGNEIQNIPIGYLKIFNVDQTFYILTARAGGFLVSHGGTYTVLNDKEIKETVTSKSNFMSFNGLDLSKPISYHYSSDQNTLTYYYTLNRPDGTTIKSTEVWKRINILP
ncbi:DUF4488 domain-containing protein [Sphingobacterium sp. HJSM2_6]|uniref:DUF4488 domain-containing protein n=1 Tax=Sphingobacterium sp. HJSM2_6 TaxID=3366264 RepID=UPI003BD2D3C1